jgi:hypothetical protein
MKYIDFIKNIAIDKKKHFIYGFVFSLFGLFWFPLSSLGFIFGVLKEIIDYYSKKGTPEIYDILYTWGGAFLALIMLCMI